MNWNVYVHVESEGEGSADLWHQHLGHLGEQQLKDMVSKNGKDPKVSLVFCEGVLEVNEA